MTTFFEQPPQYQLQPVGHAPVFKCEFGVKLVQEVLRAFNRTGNQLRVEHDIERINAEVALGLLIAPVNLNDVAQALEGMEREPDGEDDF